MWPPNMRNLAATVALFLAVAAAWEDVYHFDESVEAPGPYTMLSYHQFAVADALDGPTVTTDLVLVPDHSAETPAKPDDLAKYKSVQTSLLPLLGNLVDPSEFCAYRNGTSVFVPRILVPERAIITHRVSGEREKPQIGPISSAGMYVLIATNCAGLTGFRLKGTVSVQNPHGHLLATDYHKMTLYAALAVFYAACSLAWAALMFRWRGRLLFFQEGLLWVSLAGVGECVAMGWFYHSWNNTSAASEACFLAASVLSLWKICLAFRGVLLVSKAFSDRLHESWKVDLALAAYAGADFNFRLFRRSAVGQGLKLRALAINALPLAVMGLVFFVWGFAVLCEGNQLLRKRQAEAQASLLSKSAVLLALAAAGCAAALWAQLGDDGLQRAGAAFYADGVPQLVFALLLACSMLVWRPREAAQGCAFGEPPSAAGSRPIGAADEEEVGGDAVLAPAE